MYGDPECLNNLSPNEPTKTNDSTTLNTETLENAEPPQVNLQTSTTNTSIEPSSQIQISQQIETKNLMKFLPKINSKDYIGKELCSVCYKEVKDSQQSISCDTCPKWTHRKCCRISRKKFRKLAEIKNFEWYCKYCRIDDEKFELSPQSYQKVNESEKPDPYEKVKKSKNDLLIIHLNCRSVGNKLEELQNQVDLLEPDIVCMSETWLDNSFPLNAQIPEGFNLIRKDRNENFQMKYKKNSGGGVAILYRSYLNITEKKSLSDDTEDILWAHVQMKNSFLLGVIYRPEYSLMIDESEIECTLEKNIRKASEISNQIFITGDFNVDMRDPNDKLNSPLKDIYKPYSLKQYIKKSTRIDPKTGKGKIIDHIWATPEIEIKNSGTFLGISDHLGVYAKIPKSFTNYEPKTMIKFRNFKNYNKEKFATDFSQELSESNIDNLIEEKKLNKATETLVDIINKVAAIHAPIRFRRKKKRKKIPWMTDELKNKINNKNKLLQDFYTTRNPGLQKKVKSEQNVITSLKRLLKTTYVRKQLKKAGTDPAKLYKIYNYLLGKLHFTDIEPEGMTQEKANKCNKFFSSIGQTLVNHPKNLEPIPLTSEEQLQPTFHFQNETIENVEKMINNLNDKTATGNDEINARLIKDIQKEIAPILTKLINLGYEINDFPTCMKSAIIKPIYKKDNKNDIANYRPIAILPALSKIIERSAANQLVAFFEEHNKFTKFQHAYRKMHGTITCLAEIINNIYRAIDNKEHVAIVTLDLSKAFDCLNHQLLLQKLSKLGLNDPSISWMKAYLSNRSQVTKFKNFTSNIESPKTGVPQGSILGPLLFICFTNDLPPNFSNICTVNAYADDTQLLVTAKTVSELKKKIKSAIDTAQSWFENNFMKINTDKTKILIFNTSPESKDVKIEIKFENEIIELTSEPFVEILGIYIDPDLNWKKQIRRIKRNAMGKIRNLRRFFYMLPLQQKINLYNAIVSPQFDYGDVLWGGCNQKEINSLQRIQNFAVKSILGKKRKYSVKKCMKKLKFLNLEQRRKIHLTVFTHKAILNKSSKNLHETISSYLPKFNTRNSTNKNITIPAHNTSKFKRSPLYKMIKLGMIPQTIFRRITLSYIKNIIKSS